MKTLTPSEQTALAVLRSGGSFADAMDVSGLTSEQVQALWKEHGDRR